MVCCSSIIEPVGAELTLDAVAGAAHAGAFRVAALDHEAGDHAVEDGAVIKALLNEGNKVVDRVGRDGGVQLCFDDAAVLHFNGNNGILSHDKIPPNLKNILYSGILYL